MKPQVRFTELGRSCWFVAAEFNCGSGRLPGARPEAKGKSSPMRETDHRCYGALRDDNESIGRLLTERWLHRRCI
jgi:hypothetical protein